MGVMNSKQENRENVEGSGTLTHTEVQLQRSDHLSRFSSLNRYAVLKRTLAETDRKECTVFTYEHIITLKRGINASVPGRLP